MVLLLSNARESGPWRETGSDDSLRVLEVDRLPPFGLLVEQPRDMQGSWREEDHGFLHGESSKW